MKVARVVHEASDSGLGFVLGIVVLVMLVLAFWVWGLPAMRREATVIDVTQTVPEGGTETEIPSEIDINITGIPQY